MIAVHLPVILRGLPAAFWIFITTMSLFALYCFALAVVQWRNRRKEQHENDYRVFADSLFREHGISRATEPRDTPRTDAQLHFGAPANRRSPRCADQPTNHRQARDRHLSQRINV
jgi:hypothetical protein